MGANQSARAAERAYAGDEEVNFDHFQILRAIGKGSFGKVCIVRKKDSQKMYAMKYMNKYECAQRGALRNVLREVEILTALEHPFLVNLWFSFQDEEDLFIVSDLLLGGDLRYHVKQQVVFSEDCVKLYVCELGLALDYLRSKRIVHRDIKPDNILLDEEGHAHVTDFNIATVLENEQLATSMSGTKPYMAPEIFDCAMDECVGYGYPVDWWSLGVCAYEMLCGERPYDIHSSTSLVDVRTLFTCPISYSSSWSPAITELLSRLLCVRPGPRISTLEELKRVSCLAGTDMEAVLRKQLKPSFTPPNDHLNCDPTFELEEMIIEARPLHKKKKRLAKQRSLREMQNSLSIDLEGDIPADMEHLSEFKVYNREHELVRLERERKEQAWEEELLQAMNASDPCGLPGCTHGPSGDVCQVEHVHSVSGGSGATGETRGTGSASKTGQDNASTCVASNIARENRGASLTSPTTTESASPLRCQDAEEAARRLSDLCLGSGDESQIHQESSALKKAEFLLEYIDCAKTPGDDFS